MSQVYEQLIYNYDRCIEINNLPRDEKEKYRSVNWAFEIYPESAPSDWENKLASLLIDAFYILHDQDFKPDGTPKKAHWHIQLMFGKTKKSPLQVYEIAKYIGSDGLGGNSVVRLTNATGYARYLTHVDYADKHHYSVDDVKVIGSKDYLDIYGNTYNIKHVIREMSAFVRDHKIRYYVDLCDYADENRPDDWYDALTRKGGCSYYMREYIKSYQFKVQEVDNNDSQEMIEHLANLNNAQMEEICKLKKKIAEMEK